MGGIAAYIGVKMDKTLLELAHCTEDTQGLSGKIVPWQDCTTHKNDNILMISDTSFIVTFFHLS